VGSTGSAGTPASCHGGPTRSRRSGVFQGGRGALLTVAVPGGHTPRRCRADDRQVALTVGPVHAHPASCEPGQQPLRRVPVAVVLPHRDQRHAGAAGGEETRIGVAAAVVRNLQHVRAEIGSGGEDPRLRCGAQVPGEQDPHAALHDPDDERQVVGRRGCGRPVRGRGEHLDGGGADRPPVPGHEDRPRPSAEPDEGLERAHPLVRGREGAGGDHADVAAAERPGQTARMVGVQVRHQDEREGVDAQPIQAAVDRAGIRPGIDEDADTGAGGHDERIPLSDVAGDHERVRRRPAPDRLPQRPADHDETDHGGQREGTQTGKAPERARCRQQHDRQQDRPAGARRPAGDGVRHRRGPLGDDHEPARRPTGAPHQDVADGRDHRGGDRARQPEHGRRCDGGGGEQIGRQGDQADRSRETGDEGCRGQARSGAHREGIGQDRPAPPGTEEPRPAGRDQDDRRGGDHRQGESGIPGEPGIEEQQTADRRTQCRQCGAGSPGGQGEERDRAHGGGTHHARTRPGQDDEGDQDDSRDARLQPAVHDSAAQRPQHRREDDREVRPGHGGEVREPGSLEVLVESRVHGLRVADDQARQQPGGPRRQDAFGRRRETCAQRAGRLLERSRLNEQRGRAANGHHGERVIAWAWRGQARPDADRLSRRHVPPLLRGGEQEHVRVQAVGLRALGQGDRCGICDDAPPARQLVRDALQFEDERDRATRLCRGAQR
jgi:hypothetical protein